MINVIWTVKCGEDARLLHQITACYKLPALCDRAEKYYLCNTWHYLLLCSPGWFNLRVKEKDKDREKDREIITKKDNFA